MKRLLAVSLFALGMANATLAQDQEQVSEESNRNAAADFAQTSAANAPTIWLADAPFGKTRVAFRTPESPTLEGLSLSSNLAVPTAVAVSGSFAPLGAPAKPVSLAAPQQAHTEPFGAEGLINRMEISLSFDLVRFRSSVYSASAPGLSTSFAYYIWDKLAIEGSFTTGFAPTIFANEHIKYFAYGGGPKYVLRHARLEPWVHAIFGGGHIQPNTALGHKNALDVQAGLGVDYELVPRIAARIEMDYMRTKFFGESQNNGQALIGLVIHF